MEIVSLTLAQVRNAADEFLKKYNRKGLLPVPIEDIAELSLNIFVCAVPGIKNLIGIDGFITSDFTQITIDEHCYTKFVERTRFTIAHEIGHKILHQEWYIKNGPKDFSSHQDFFSKISGTIDIWKYRHKRLQVLFWFQQIY